MWSVSVVGVEAVRRVIRAVLLVCTSSLTFKHLTLGPKLGQHFLVVGT